MAKKARKKRVENGSAANLGFEEKLWAAADKMRGHMDAAEYKHVALGLIFLKYISDAFEERRRFLFREMDDPDSVGAEALEEDDEPFEEKMMRLTQTLDEQFKESRRLEKAIRKNLAGLGFEP